MRAGQALATGDVPRVSGALGTPPDRSAGQRSRTPFFAEPANTGFRQHARHVPRHTGSILQSTEGYAAAIPSARKCLVSLPETGAANVFRSFMARPTCRRGPTSPNTRAIPFGMGPSAPRRSGAPSLRRATATTCGMYQPGNSSDWPGTGQLRSVSTRAAATPSLRRTEAALIYCKIVNLRAVQLLPGQTKVGSTVRHLGAQL